MSDRMLIWRSWKQGRPLAVLQRDGETVRIMSVDEGLRPDAERWVSQGFTRWQGKGSKARPVHVKPGDGEFFENLREHLSQHYRIRSTVWAEPVRTLVPDAVPPTELHVVRVMAPFSRSSEDDVGEAESPVQEYVFSTLMS